MGLQAEARQGLDEDWFLVDVPGLRRPAAVVAGGGGWRVRLLAVDPDGDGTLSFFGEDDASGLEAALCVAFGDFASPGPAMEFLGVLSKSSPTGGSVSMKDRHRGVSSAVPPEAAASESFCFLERDADPASSARRAVVLLFEVERPSFDGRIAEAIDRSRLVPVRGDIHAAEAYASHLERVPVPAIAGSFGGVQAMMNLPVDEVIRYPVDPASSAPLDGEVVDVFAAAPLESDEEDLDAEVPFEDVDETSDRSNGGMKVRRMGVLEQDRADEVARIGSALSAEGDFKLRVDESADEGEDGVFRRSFQVFHVIKPGKLANTRLRAALVGMLDEEASRRKASPKG